jgi:uncharacterized protein YecT (DUF1311 family)
MSAVRFVVCLWLATMGFFAAAHAQASLQPEAAPTSQEVLSALSERSKLPEEDLRRLTADCAAGQQSMYFCAYRDVVSAELKLQRVVAEKKHRLPACQAAIETRVERWKAARDPACAKSAAREWGGGSMEPTARNICLSDSTGRMVQQMQRMSACPRR